MDNNPKLLQSLLRQELTAFTQKCFATVSPGDRYIHNWHIELICDRLQAVYQGKIKRLIITVPPRELKSITTSVAFPAWALGHDPTRRFICASYSQDLAKKHSLDTRAVLESSWYKDLFPKTRLHPRKNTEVELLTTQMGGRYATSVEGTLTGRGGNIIIIDDPIKPQDALSTLIRERVNAWFDNTLYSRLNDKLNDAIIVVMQRVHEDDLVGHLTSAEVHGWALLEIPAIAEADTIYKLYGIDQSLKRPKGHILNGRRESLESLHATRLRMGSRDFSAQYQQRPVPNGGNLLRLEWFQQYRDGDLPRDFSHTLQVWDTASCTGTTNDYSACTTWRIYGPRSYLLHVYRNRLEFPDLKRVILKHAIKHSADGVFIESSGSGLQLIQQFKSEGSLWPLFTHPKVDKQTRAAAQTPKLEAGLIYIPEDAPWLRAFLNEVAAFPAGKFDDQVDSLIHFLEYRSHMIAQIDRDSRYRRHLR